MKIKDYIYEIRRAAAYIKKRAPKGWKPDVAVILGSGLSGAAPKLSSRKIIPYKNIPGFPRTTVIGHSGRLLLGTLGRRRVAVLQGRFHYYEGHSMESIALPIRALEYLGLKTVIITSAVGSMTQALKPGDLCVVNDHMNFMGRNPLRAFHEEEFGEMFPDLVDAYTPALRKIALRECKRLGLRAKEGVYTAAGGPSYETAAEIRAFSKLGGDIVGMSVVPEVVVARQMGLKILAISWIANMAAGISSEVLSHHDVLGLGQKMAGRLRRLLTALLPKV